MKEKTFQRNEKKMRHLINSYYLKNHIYLSDIVISLILNVTTEVLCIFIWNRNKQIDSHPPPPPGKNEPAHIIFLSFF